ncbi:MAG: hypothetical protein P9M03_06020 [Candidatus Theseobacter exili]|nr:hypothetical protein [Candidatus Theseobacter exili]
MKRFIFFLWIFLLILISANDLQALKISDFYKEVQPGQWILMKSSDGLSTRTIIEKKDSEKIELQIESFSDKELISISDQIYDCFRNKIVYIKTRDKTGRIFELSSDDTQTDDFFNLDYTLIGEETVMVPAGKFICKVYKAIYQDHVVKAWISTEVPVFHLVKISAQGISVRLVDFGCNPQ